MIVVCLFFVLNYHAIGQSSPITFGAISREDLEMQPYAHEKGAEAVVMNDFMSANIIYNDGFKIEIQRHVRIKIFKPSGFDQANIRIDYTRDDDLTDLKAATYNLVNNELVATPVERKQFYKEKTLPYRYATRFAFPQVREGSVIEFSYKEFQDEIREFVPFDFQRSIPVRHVEFWSVIPDIFTYTIKYNGNDKIKRNQSQKNGYFETQSTLLKINVWTGNHLPSLQPEPEMPESREYFPGVRFSLTEVNFPGIRTFEVAPSYKKLTTDILQFGGLGPQLDNRLLFSREVKEITQEKTGKIEQMKAVYDHVCNHVNWNGFEYPVPNEPIRIAYRDKTGNNADINSILINMLRTAGINADPVVLSTRSNGTLNQVVALMGDLDYMICLAEIDGREFLLDATNRFRPMGMLPFRCLNRQGWVLNESRGRWVDLLNNEKKSVRKFYDFMFDAGGKISASVKATYEGYDADYMRELIHNQTIAGLTEEFADSIGSYKISNLEVQNLENIYEPLSITYSLESNSTLISGDNLVFFKPLFGSPGNPWIKDERIYPVDLGCPGYYNITCVYHLPDNLKIEEIPQSIRLILPGSDAIYTYRISNNNNLLTLNEELEMTRTWFEPGEYSVLREFYTQINKKKNEMVVMH